jgi:hypothetical protein
MSNVNLIANGNFENGFTGWDASGNIVTKEANISLAAIFNGGDTVGNGILAQKFPTVNGQIYNLTFDYGVLGNPHAQDIKIEVIGTRNTLVSQKLNVIGPNGSLVLKPYSYNFIADGATTTLKISDSTSLPNSIGCDSVLKNVSVVLVPIPAAINVIEQVAATIHTNTGVTTNISGQPVEKATSDKRLKMDITDLSLGLDFITKLRPVQYIRNNNSDQTQEWGIIAQELQQTLEALDYKDAGIITVDQSAEKYLSVRYNDLLAPMIKAIQEQEKKIDSQQETIAALLERIEALENNNLRRRAA